MAVTRESMYGGASQNGWRWWNSNGVGRPPVHYVAPVEVEAAPAEDRKENPPHLYLTVTTLSGLPVNDDAGFVLLAPDGATEDAQLSNGVFEKTGVHPGEHRARFKYLENARWSVPSMCVGDTVEMRVTAKWFAPGTAVTFKVFESTHPPDASPLAEVQGTVQDGEAVVSWTHQPPQGGLPTGRLVFEAEVGQKWATSRVLVVGFHPLRDIRGVKERLSQAGYDAGPAGPEVTQALEDALKRFQEHSGFFEPTGKVDGPTLALLGARWP